jgi:hypothetical protein
MPSVPVPLRALLLLSAVWFSGGCATVYEVKVDAASRVAGFSPAGTSFAIVAVHNQSGAEPGELRRNAIANSVKTALSAHGLYEAADPTGADLIVEISYGIDPAKLTRTVNQELAFGRPVGAFDRLGPPPESAVARAMMGYAQLESTEITREKYVSICARENRSMTAERPPQDFWQVHVTIENESRDLRGHLPVLVSAAMDYIGRTTEGEVTLTMRQDDEAIRFVQRGL